MRLANIELTEKIASGPNADVYKYDKWAVKVFKAERPKTEVLYEALTQSRIEETGLPVPRVRDVTRDSDKHWVIATQLIEGRTLLDLMKENPGKLDDYVEDFVNLQLEVHSKRIPSLVKLKDKFMAAIKNAEGISETTRYDLMTRLESMPKHVKLCHGNFDPSNIIVNEEGYHIVDWVEASQGNASADAARTYMLLTLELPEAAEKYLGLFCEKSKTDKRYVQSWLPIVAASHLAIASEDEKDLLKKWVDVVDYE